MHTRRHYLSGRSLAVLLLIVGFGFAPRAARAQDSIPPAATPGAAVWANFDFVPGERVLFAEDFARDRVGNFPQRLELVTGNMEVVESQSKRWLRIGSGVAVSSFTIPLPQVLPQRFTMEFDLTIPWGSVAIYSAARADRLGASPERTSAFIVLAGGATGVGRGNGEESNLVDPRGLFPDFFAAEGDAVSRVFRVSVEVDGRYVKVYLDQQRVANIPNADFGRANKIIFDFENTENENRQPVLLGNLSINAGGNTMYDALSTAGRVATQGIYFDVGSDRIRGESTPTLRQIADMLNAHPDLRLTVEGHTDNTGNAAANQSLSLRRAQAIVAYLTGTSGIAASRLVASGLGDTRPAAPNTTPEGRQSNRRVELVRM
jgi:outer membrane protein OmpA-like peptidoglycan-associated protein